MPSPLARHHDELRALSARYQVRSLEVFGSAATSEFDVTHSDIDLLAEFDPHPGMTALEQYIGFIREAEALLGRKVDVVNPRYITNPHFKAEVDATRRPLDAA